MTSGALLCAFLVSAATVACGGNDSATDQFSPSVDLGSHWKLEFESESEAIFVTDTQPDGTIAFLYPSIVFNPENLSTTTEAPEDIEGWIREHPQLEVIGEEDVTVGTYVGTRIETKFKTLINFPVFASAGEEYRVRFNGQAYFYILEVDGNQMVIYAAPYNWEVFPHFSAFVEETLASAEIGED